MKYHSSYSRKVQAKQYESISKTQGVEYHDGEMTPEEAHQWCKDVVHQLIADELTELGLWRHEYHYKEAEQ